MNRKFGIGILIVCFSASGVNLSWAYDGMQASPVMLQPYAMQAMNQQILDLDRQNRNEEIAINELVEENDKLIQANLAHQQDEELSKIDKIMLSYRDALLSRDRARIVVNSQRAEDSRYAELIDLTEDVDAMKVHQDLKNKSGALAEKYQMLTDLKSEMIALNAKLKGGNDQQSQGIGQRDSIIDGLKKIDQQQEEKIMMFTQRLAEMDTKIAHFDEIIADKDRQIALLNNRLARAQGDAASKDEMIKEKNDQLGLLKTELENKITQENNQSSKDETIKQLEKQIDVLKEESLQVASKEAIIKSQAEQVAQASEQFKDQSAVYANVKANVVALKSKLEQQAVDLKAKNESIRWLNQVVAAAKNKAQYYQVVSEQDHQTMQQLQQQVQTIKADLAEHSKNYDQFENAIASLKDQVSQLGQKLSQKQDQVDLLKKELEKKASEENSQAGQETQIQEALKAQLQDKENQIIQLKTNIQAIQQAQENKEIYNRKVYAQLDDRVKLADQLIDLQKKEAALLEEKDNLAKSQNTIFEQHALDLEKKIRGLWTNHQMQTLDLQSRMEELKSELEQKKQQVDLLTSELNNKISEGKNQGVLSEQIEDLKVQLKDSEDQLASMKPRVQEGESTKEDLDSLKQQLIAQQNKTEVLRQQLDIKTAESDKLTLMVGAYQKKLESKDNAYNQQLGKLLNTRNTEDLRQKQIDFLNARLQQKEAEIIKIKKAMYDLQEMTNAKDRDVQTQNLNLSMVQQKMMEKKINDYQVKIDGLQASSVTQAQEIKSLKTELALARQELVGVPSNDEIVFLKAGLNKATVELNQKDGTITQIKANAEDYEKKFKEQSLEFQSLKVQLQNAYDQLTKRNEDLKYKAMEITRLKLRSKSGEHDLQAQVKDLTQKLEAADRNSQGKNHENRIGELETKLQKATLQIKDLQEHLKQLTSSSKNDPVEMKLKQALDKINEQGQLINVLVSKLQENGQTVDLTKDTGK